MKKNILIFNFLVCLLWTLPAAAQNYKAAIGARLGYPLSLSAKLFLNENNAVEAYVGTRGYSGFRWVSISAAYQRHAPLPIDNVEGLSYYYGVGGNVYFWSYKDVFVQDNTTTSFGISGYIGLDYAFENVPLNLTVDWVPTYFVNSFAGGFGAGYGSLGVRYIFSRGNG